MELCTLHLFSLLTSVSSLCCCLYLNKKSANLDTSTSSMPKAWKGKQNDSRDLCQNSIWGHLLAFVRHVFATYGPTIYWKQLLNAAVVLAVLYWYGEKWTHGQERAQLHNSLFVLLQGRQQLQEFILHQEALKKEERKHLVGHIISHYCWFLCCFDDFTP